MTISYPVTLPTTRVPRSIRFIGRAVVGLSVSPFTQEQQAYEHQGQCWYWNVSFGEMNRADAEALVGFLLSLNGRLGTFTMGDPMGATPRGTWAGAPKVLGSHAAGVNSIAMDGFTAAATVKAGDYIQRGSGASTHLHKVTVDATANGSGLLTLDIWPRLRAALIDNDTFTTSNTVGLFRLTSNDMAWDINDVRYGLSFDCMEAL
jgi:hypothetical protein